MRKFGVLMTVCLFMMMLFFPFLTHDKKDNIVELKTKVNISLV